MGHLPIEVLALSVKIHLMVHQKLDRCHFYSIFNVKCL